LLQRHPEAFGADFEENKKALEDMAFIPSKQLRNRIAGYIAKSHKQYESEEQPESSEEKKE